jgi:hypothetical protein
MLEIVYMIFQIIIYIFLDLPNTTFFFIILLNIDFVTIS